MNTSGTAALPLERLRVLELGHIIAGPSAGLVEVHHVAIFVVHVEQVDLVRQDAAIETAFLHQHDVEAVRIGVDGRGAHAAGRAFTADDYRIYPKLRQMSNECRAEEGAGPLLDKHDFAILRRDLRLEFVDLGIVRC